MELRSPAVIHCWDAYVDCLDILTAFLPGDWRVHFHCFAETMVTYVPKTYIGLTAAVTHGREPFRQLAEGVPLQRLLLETDAPYFVPAGDYHSFSRPSCAFEGKVASRQECHPERCDDVWTVGLYMVCCI